MDKNAQRYYQSAKDLMLPVQSLAEINGFELILGSKHYLFRESETPFNNISSSNIVSDKYCTNQILKRADIPVPRAVALSYADFLDHQVEALLSPLTYPLVIKPLLNSSQGKDVLCNIKTMEALLSYLPDYFLHYEHLIIEEFHGGLNSYRVLVFNNNIVGVVHRLPASVLGDGRHTIKELIDLTNEWRQKTHDFLGPILVDEECLIRLQELNKTLNDIPKSGERLTLAYTSNATRGGTFETVNTFICKENRQLMLKTAAVLHLGLAGIDVECQDLSIPIRRSQGVIIEVNHRPSIRIHELPLRGKPQWVTKKIMRSFIYRHPFAYLGRLFCHSSMRVYLRTLFISILGVVIYLLL